MSWSERLIAELPKMAATIGALAGLVKVMRREPPALPAVQERELEDLLERVIDLNEELVEQLRRCWGRKL